MDCFETVLYQYYKKTQEHLFPKGIKAKDKFKIYFINFTHIIGTLYILFGEFWFWVFFRILCQMKKIAWDRRTRDSVTFIGGSDHMFDYTTQL